MNNHLTLTNADVAAIVDGVVAKINARFAAVVEPEIINRVEAKALLRCNSNTALSRALADLKIKRVGPGKFRRKEIINAIARRALGA